MRNVMRLMGLAAMIYAGTRLSCVGSVIATRGLRTPGAAVFPDLFELMFECAVQMLIGWLLYRSGRR